MDIEIIVTLYAMLGVVWALYAAARQAAISDSGYKYVASVTINFLFWPLCILIAKVRGKI